MQITVEQLLKIVINANYLTKTQKNEILSEMMYMNKKEMTELAYIFTNAEIEKRNHLIEQDLITGLLAQVFNIYNKKIEGEEESEKLKRKKKAEKENNSKKIENLLKKLDNA